MKFEGWVGTLGLFFWSSLDPGAGIVQEVIVHIVQHALTAQVNQHHVRDLPDHQQSFRGALAEEARFRFIFLVEQVTVDVVIGLLHMPPEVLLRVRAGGLWTTPGI